MAVNTLPPLSDAPIGRRAPAGYGLLRVAGPDAVGFLQRLCSQDVEAMPAGNCQPAAFLNAKGKLVATCTIGRIEAAAAWLVAPAAHLAALAALLDRYHFSEQLAIEQPEGSSVELVGPGVCAAVGLEPGSCTQVGDVRAFAQQRHGVQWVRAFGPDVELQAERWAPPGVVQLTDALAEYLRIRAGDPSVGVDTEEATLGLEAGIDDHVSLTKGCYTGQEIVARIHTYGHVNRALTLLAIDAPDDVPVGTVLVEPDDGDPVGRVMSSAPVPGEARRVALGYLPRDFWDAGTRVVVGGLDGAAATVVAFAE